MADNPILEEYKICARAGAHLDEQNWMWGSFLFGGTLAATGFVLSQRVGWVRLLGLSLVSSVILIGYLQYVQRGMKVRDVYAARMRQIEEQHLPMINTERLIDMAKKRPIVFKQGEQPISVSGPRAFHVLQLMVLGYLAILWIGTFAAWLLSKGLLKPN
jgi:hypothetical protein